MTEKHHRKGPACKHGHIWTKKTVYIDKRGFRACRTCLRLKTANRVAALGAREYWSYKGAKARCLNIKDQNYGNYGGRGIQFKFESFGEFLAILGPRPPRTSLDRINNDGHYEPGNVRWATYKQQANNQRPRIRLDDWDALVEYALVKISADTKGSSEGASV